MLKLLYEDIQKHHIRTNRMIRYGQSLKCVCFNLMKRLSSLNNRI